MKSIQTYAKGIALSAMIKEMQKLSENTKMKVLAY